MATKKFENSYKLINYLCQKDVLGEITISFSQNAPYNSYKFVYPELEEHLNSVLFNFIEQMSGVSSYQITFYDAEEFDVEAGYNIDNSRYTERKLSKEINSMVERTLRRHLDINAYASLDIEGSLLEIEGGTFSADTFNLKEFKVSDFDNQEDPVVVSDNIRKEILEGIAIILSEIDPFLERISDFYLNYTYSSHTLFTAKGLPYMDTLPHLKDGKEFILDTEKLIK